MRKQSRRWTRREIALASVAGAAILLAALFGAAWATGLVLYEPVWGNVAEWAGVGVTALGFFLAWLTFRHQMSTHNKAESERDLHETFQLRQFMDEAQKDMYHEAAAVRVFPALNNFRLVDDQTMGAVLFCVIENGTGGSLTGIKLRYPAITTNLGSWEGGSLTAENSTERHISLELPVMVPIARGVFFRQSRSGAIEPGEDVEGALDGLNLSYRLNSGPQWKRTWRDGHLQDPELAPS